MRFGLEAEYLLDRGTVYDLLGAGLPGVSAEFYQQMVEVITDPHADPRQAVAELHERVVRLQTMGVPLLPTAAFTRARTFTLDDVTKPGDPYYRWVFETAAASETYQPENLHYVGIHINISDPRLAGDALIHAANWLRCMSFLFVLLTANSPDEASGLSMRMLRYPNRYDVPFWESEVAFRRWIAEERAVGRMYHDRHRVWMPVAPRLNTVDELHLIELRPLDGGLAISWDAIEGCCVLAQRIVEHALTHRHLPVELTNLEQNDKAVARLGRRARVRFGGEDVSVLDVAHRWCVGIHALEHALEHGSPAEQFLRMTAS